MYIPPAFAETNLDTLHGFIGDNSFAIVVASSDGQLLATHLPLLLERDSGEQGTLIGHMALANPQSQAIDGQSALVIFSGPHAYISPSAMHAENVVPTWNYVAVHVYGQIKTVEQPNENLEILARFVDYYERTRTQPWQFDPANSFNQKLAEMIVGFRIPIERIEGKWKLSQNHSAECRQNVINDLHHQNSHNAGNIASLMTETL